mgnify:FL=1
MQRRALLKLLASGAIMLHSPTLYAVNEVKKAKPLS